MLCLVCFKSLLSSPIPCFFFFKKFDFFFFFLSNPNLLVILNARWFAPIIGPCAKPVHLIPSVYGASYLSHCFCTLSSLISLHWESGSAQFFAYIVSGLFAFKLRFECDFLNRIEWCFVGMSIFFYFFLSFLRSIFSPIFNKTRDAGITWNQGKRFHLSLISENINCDELLDGQNLPTVSRWRDNAGNTWESQLLRKSFEPPRLTCTSASWGLRFQITTSMSFFKLFCLRILAISPIFLIYLRYLEMLESLTRKCI